MMDCRRRSLAAQLCASVPGFEAALAAEDVDAALQAVKVEDAFAVLLVEMAECGSLKAKEHAAILLRQMLSSARSTDFGGNDLFGESDDTFREMRDARFAELTAQTGQLGFASAIEKQLARFLPKGEN